MRLLTNDIYEGAWLLSEGMELADLWIKGNGKKSVVFEFHGEKVNLLQRNYRKGKAQANVLKLKSAMNELKDRMFWLLRTKEAKPNRWRTEGDNYARPQKAG